MSRIGKQIIKIPEGTSVSLNDGIFSAKGPKGQISRKFLPSITISINEKDITLLPVKDTVLTRALWGTYAAHIKNMIAGVNEPFVKKLILEGVGFKSEVKGKEIVLALGFSHPVNVEITEGLTVTAEKNLITVSGIDKDSVGQFASKLRSLKKPEPYKGKGFRYDNEVIRRKQGKKSA